MMPLQEEADADAAEAAAMVWGLIVVSTRWNRFDGKKLGIFSLKTGHLLWLKSTNILILSNTVNRNHQATAVLCHQGRCTVAGEPQVAQRVGEFARLGALAAEWGGHLSWRFNLHFFHNFSPRRRLELPLHARALHLVIPGRLSEVGFSGHSWCPKLEAYRLCKRFMNGV